MFMHRPILTLLFFLVINLGSVVFAKEPPNIHFVQERLTSYYDSGNYYFDVERIISRAKTCIKNRIKNDINKNKKTALVLDIDDTSLALIDYDHKMTFGMSPMEFRDTVLKANAKAIAQTLNLYNFVKSKGRRYSSSPEE